MRLNPQSFNTFLAQIGQSVLWQQAHACPCLNPNSGAPDPYCPNCHGKGRIWDAAVTGHLGVSGAKVQREWATFGNWEQGDIVLTIPSDSPVYAINQFDRVVMTNSTSPFSIVLRPGELVLPYPSATVERVFWLNPTTKAIVEGALPTVAAGGAMTWAAGAAPPVDLQYSISGRRSPEYFCFGEFAQDRAHQMGSALPRRVVLRRFDLFGRG